MSSEKKRGRGRPRSFQLVQNAHGKVGGRVTRTIDGETVRKRVKLETTDDAVARIKLRRLARDTTAPVAVATSDETFLEAATRVNADRVRAGVYKAKSELQRITKHASAIADTPITSVTSKDIKKVLKGMQATGMGWQSVKHVRGYIKLVFDALVDDDNCLVASNPVLATKVPEFRATVKKIKGVLEDAELFVYLDYKHPREFHQIGVFQRQVMSCVARCLGGQRTNDLHESRWEQFTIEDGEFPSALVLRTKGKQLERMVVPPILRPFLRAWWIHQGKPKTGLIFPTLRGKRLGQVKIGVGHAKAFRADLRRAFGIERWDETGGKRKSGAWVKAREMTERERELFIESAYTKPVDFHSWRRAFVQAVDAVDLDAKAKRKLSGHEDEAVRQVYLQSTKRREWVVPASALPVRPGAEPAAAPSPEKASGGILGQLPAFIQKGRDFVATDSPVVSASSRRARKDSNLRPTAPESRGQLLNPAKSSKTGHEAADEREAITPSHEASGLNHRPKIGAAPALSESDLTCLLELATQKKKWALVASLSAQLEALAATKADTGVTSIADARRRRDERAGDKP